MSDIKKREDLEFDSSITTSDKGSAILGRISGPCADIVSATRNGRRYSEALWQKVFKDPIVLEYFEAGGIFGELNHPADRDETDLEKVAICMPKPPVKNNDGKLIGQWDILNTPNGRIAKCLFDYGYKLGISSRGSGDTFTDYDGQESVDPDSYTLQGFDLVYLPAVRAARLAPVNESLDMSKKSLKRSLCEALESANEDERRIMEETLDSLNIDYAPDSEEVTEEVDSSKTIPEKDDNIDVIEETVEAADDNGVEIVKELQEALQANQDLESQIKDLQEKLSVCYTKEDRYVETLRRTKKELAESLTRVSELEQKCNDTDAKCISLTESLTKANDLVKSHRATITELNKQIKVASESSNTLTENLNTHKTTVKSLKEQLEKAVNDSKKEKELFEKEKSKLQEGLLEAKNDAKIIKTQANAKLTSAQQLVEKYKNVAKLAVDKYINSQAVALGIKPEEIKNRLKENYSFNDIDKVCEEVQRYKINLRALPFDVSAKKPLRMRINESRPIVDPVTDNDNRVDDDIDDTLTSFLNNN